MSYRAEESSIMEFGNLTEGPASENSFEESVESESSSAQSDFGLKEAARWVLPSSPWLDNDLHAEEAEVEHLVELEGEERNVVSAAGAAEGEMLFEGAEGEEFHTHEHSESEEEGHDKHEGENTAPPGDPLPTEPEFSLPSDSVPALSVPESGASQSNVSTISDGDTSGAQVSTPADSGANSTISDPLSSPMSASPPSTPDQSSLSDTKFLDMQPTSPQDSNFGHSDSSGLSSDSSGLSSDSSGLSSDSSGLSSDSSGLSSDSSGLSSDSSGLSSDSSGLSSDSSSLSSDSSFGDSGANPTDHSMIEPIDHGQMSLF
jgi:hypothetical protein